MPGISAAKPAPGQITCPVCLSPGAPVLDQRGALVEHPRRAFPCRVPDVQVPAVRAAVEALDTVEVARG